MTDPVIVTIAAAATAIVLLVGAVQKLRDLMLFEAAIEGYELAPALLVKPLTLALPLAEGAAGLLLLRDRRPKEQAGHRPPGPAGLEHVEHEERERDAREQEAQGSGEAHAPKQREARQGDPDQREEQGPGQQRRLRS